MESHKPSYVPYTYWLTWSQYGMNYIGARYAKNCHPDDLWVKYFTTSRYVKDFVKKYGDPDIRTILRTFNDSVAPLKHEDFLLRRNCAVGNPAFLNKAISGIFDSRDPDIRKRRGLAIRGRIVSKETREKQRAKMKGRTVSAETRAKIGLKSSQHKWTPAQYARMVGRKDSAETLEKKRIARLGKTFGEETRKKISASKKGRPLSDEHKKNIGLSQKGKEYTPEQLEMFQKILSKRNTEQVICPHCDKTGGRPSMLLHHFDKCSKLTGVRRKYSEETKRKIGEKHKLNNSKNKVTCPHCNKIGSDFNMRRYHFDNCATVTGVIRTQSEEFKQKIRLKATGRKCKIVQCPHCLKSGGFSLMSRYHFDKCETLTGVPHKAKPPSEETRKKMSLSRTGKKQPIVTCPHCDKSGGKAGMATNHFNNCKSIKKETLMDTQPLADKP